MHNGKFEPSVSYASLNNKNKKYPLLSKIGIFKDNRIAHHVRISQFCVEAKRYKLTPDSSIDTTFQMTIFFRVYCIKILETLALFGFNLYLFASTSN